jgi:hypothetical protein
MCFRAARHVVTAHCASAHTGLDPHCYIADVRANVTALTLEADIIYKGDKYPILHLSAHNPQVCITAIKVAKVCVKVENLNWANSTVSGVLYAGVEVLHEVKFWKIDTFSIPLHLQDQALLIGGA